MYIPLFNKTTYTFLSSLLNVDDLINLAKDNNLDSIAICDNNMFGAMEFIKKCQANNLNPIVGVDFKSRLLFAKNYQGYKNLLKLTSFQSEKNLSDDDFNRYRDNLICIPFEKINTSYENIFYPYNEKTKDLDNAIYIPLHLYKEEGDYEILKYLELLRDNKTITSEYTEKKNCYYNMINTKNKAIDNTFNLASMCHLELPKYSLNLAIFNKEINSDEYLRILSYKGLEKRLNGNITKIYLERLKHELEIISKMGFSNYFLVVYDFIKYAKSKGILVGPGRGSAAGSLVSFTLGITEIDPIKYNLLFERFLNPERVTMPDIDTDFPDTYRDDVINYVVKKYGKDHVSGIITFDTMGAKMCIRDIGRVMNVASADIDYLSKIIGNRKENLKELIKSDIKLQMAIKQDIKIKKLISVAIKVEGIKRHRGVHAAGILISNTPLNEVVPLVYDDGKIYISGYEASYLEDLGLLKMDFLGIKNLTTIMEIEKEVERLENIKIDFREIPLDDKETIELFQNGDTNGIFQFESSGMKNFLRELKPNNFLDLSNAIALFRPGPAESIPSFIKRRNKLEEVDYFTSELESILKPTFGIIIYQEQIMQIASIIAGYTLGEADILRRAMSKKKKEMMLEEKEKFLNGAIKNGYEKDLAEKIFNLILKFASYGFNKSHSVAYTMTSYKMAYLKVHYKKYFYVSLLSSVIRDNEKTVEYLYELKKYNLEVLKPDIRYSTTTYLIKDDKILAPLTLIKGISKIVCDKIIIENRNFKTIYDVFSKLNTLTKTNFEMLIRGGLLDYFGYSRKTLLTNLDSLVNYANLCKDLDKEFVLKPEIIEEKEYDNLELIEMEKEIYGFYLSNHPTISYKAKQNDIIDLKNIDNYFNTSQTMIVLVEGIREITTKKGDKMLFFRGSDEERVIEFIVFPKTYQDYFDIRKGYILKVLGKIEKRNGNYQVIVSKIKRLDKEEK